MLFRLINITKFKKNEYVDNFYFDAPKIVYLTKIEWKTVNVYGVYYKNHGGCFFTNRNIETERQNVVKLALHRRRRTLKCDVFCLCTVEYVVLT